VTRICPPHHRHAATSTCNKNHRCMCDPCRAGERVRNSTRQKIRRRAKAYGTYQGHIPALGTQRRIQGLQYIGWTLTDIGRVAGGVSNTAIGLILTRETVAPETAERIKTVFRHLLAKGNGGSTITTARAKARGYASPFAWENIDDPNETPTVVRNPDRREMDPIAIDLAVAGEKVELNLREREEVIRRLNNLRWPDKRIGKHLGITGDTINRTRRRLGLPTWAYQDRATEYGQEHRETAA
jgi:hypothetical protein